MTIKKIHIPLEDINKETMTAATKANDKTEIDNQGGNITNQQLEIDISRFSVKTTIFLNFTTAFLLSIKHEKDLIEGNWHYIPYDVPEDQRQGFKFAIELFCVENKTTKKRLEKLIKRHAPGKLVEWELVSSFNLLGWLADPITISFPQCMKKYNEFQFPEREIYAVKEFWEDLHLFFMENEIVLFPLTEAQQNPDGFYKCFETLEKQLTTK